MNAFRASSMSLAISLSVVGCTYVDAQTNQQAKQGVSVQDDADVGITVRDEVFNDFRWCSIHEGMPIFDNREPGRPRDPKVLRKECMDFEESPSQREAKVRVSKLTDAQIVWAVRQIGHQLGENTRDNFDLRYHMAWCEWHERKPLVGDAIYGNFMAVISHFHQCQSHNPSIRNLINGAPNELIAKSAETMPKCWPYNADLSCPWKGPGH